MLAHDVVGESSSSAGGRTAIFLHGILGNRNNWKGFCRRARERVSDLRCVVVDLRGHGQSHGEPPPHTIDACARDVTALMAALGGAHVVVGHSFGGKVALEIARHAPPGLAQVAVLDAPPGVRTLDAERAGGASDVVRVIEKIKDVPLPIPSRKALVETLTARGLSEPLALWMTTNLRPADGSEGLTWAFDLEIVGQLLRSFGALDLWPFLEQRTRADLPRVTLVRARRGDRFTDDDVERAERLAREGRIDTAVVDAGHWLHTENADGTLAVLEPILRGRA